MKRIKMIIMTIILLLSYNVMAASASLNLSCNKTELTKNSSASCTVNLMYSDYAVSKVEFDYTSSLDLALTKANGSTLTTSSNHATITFDSAKEAEDIRRSVEIANLTVSGKASLDAGNYSLELKNIKVYAGEDNLTPANVVEGFTIEEVALSSDNSLKSITIDGKEITGFSSTKYYYENITVYKQIVKIDAEKNHAKASVYNVGDTILKEGTPVTIHLTVVAEDKSERTYTLVITYQKEEPKSEDNTLKTLEIYHDKDKLDFAYNDKKTSFDFNVDSDIDKVTLKATLNDSKASFVTKYGPRDVTLNYGKNKVYLKVKSEKGDEKTYTLNIVRNDNRSDDSSLSSLAINNQRVVLEKNKLSYEVKLANSEEKTKVYAVSSSETSKIEYEDIDLVVGENTLKIKVTSEKGSVSEYQIKVIREEEIKVYLEKITIEGYEFPFSKDKTTYDLTLKKEDTKLNISVVPKENIFYEVLNNQNLEDNSVVVVHVKDSSGDLRYTINIHKEADMEWLPYLCYGVFGLGVILFISSIIYLAKKKK